MINIIAQDKKIHPNNVRHVIKICLDEVTESLQNGQRLEFSDFGIFEVVERQQKIGRNPKKANIPILIPARQTVKFTSGKKMDQLTKKKKKAI